MKKFIALVLVLVMVLGMVACGGGEGESDTPATPAGILAESFKTIAADESLTAEDIANQIIENDIIPYGMLTMPVEPGLLNGFDNNEITGFAEGAIFAPMIGSVPFIGYVFTLEDGQDAEAFASQLKESANLNWNICTTADEMVTATAGNKVFFTMAPSTFDAEE